MPVPLAPQRCPECGFSASRAVPGRSRSGASPGLITRSATGAVSALAGSVLCTAAPDPTGLSRLLPSCGDVGRMNLARYSSSQTSHGRPIAAIPASFNAQRYEITEGMLLLLLTFYFFFITRVTAFVPNTVQAAFGIGSVMHPHAIPHFLSLPDSPVVPPPEGSAPGRLRAGIESLHKVTLLPLPLPRIAPRAPECLEPTLAAPAPFPG